MKVLDVIVRLIEAVLNGINKHKAKTVDPAANITNNDELRESDISYSDLAREIRSGKTK